VGSSAYTVDEILLKVTSDIVPNTSTAPKEQEMINGI
jgi:hypothetical protein